ncbi:E3 ubiquitin-protein ligase rnf8-A-like [Leguminivora glycinivorella]|uniref:E3 ubiquitin-protein ligase rnf8-A-like n=1 Tax=Leguminivora glycinivorella TaxID=1035111 RepID=UPI00200FEEB6|nr:E3 ubiquitin-protein ligase rnf8-A-like [Leguminivora glycinivorella]
MSFKRPLFIQKVEGHWTLENCSYSSIKVNDNKLRKGEAHTLTDQDIIKLESSNELVYKFTSNIKSSKRKRRKNDENKKSESPRRTSRLVLVTKNEKHMSGDVNKSLDDTLKLKEQILSEQSNKEKEIYDDYAVRMERLKGSKKNVKNQKALLKMRRNKQLELNRMETEDRIASMMAQQDEATEPKHSKDKPRHGQGDQGEDRREQDRARAKERRELKKLRRETRRLKLDKEKKLKELEKQKQRREKELQSELDKVNKKLAKEKELHEKERRRAEQLLDQKKAALKKVPPTSSDSKLDMESELQCSICSELFVRATTLGCSHSFCRYCIRKWTANKKECPICRAAITSECRSIVLDSLVDKMADTADARKKRQELVKSRDELEAKEKTTTTIDNETQRYLFDPDFIRRFLEDENSNESESSYHGRESSLEPDFDMLVPMDTDSSVEPSSFDSDDYSNENENYDENDYEGNSGSDRENEYDEAPEEDHDNSENYGQDEEGENSENYEEGENSQTDNEDQEENPECHEGGESDNYEEGEPEGDEGENSASENYEEPDIDEGENTEPENYEEGEGTEPENYDEGENSGSENYDEGEVTEPENYDEGENTEPENYDEGENTEPENYDEGENSPGDYSAPEYDGDSYADDGDDDYY